MFKQVYMFTCVCPCGRCHWKRAFNNWTVCVFPFCLCVCSPAACAQIAGQFLKAVVRASLIRPGAAHTDIHIRARARTRMGTGVVTWPQGPSVYVPLLLLFSCFCLFELSTICLYIFQPHFHHFRCTFPLSPLHHPLPPLLLVTDSCFIIWRWSNRSAFSHSPALPLSCQALWLALSRGC